MSDDDLVFLAEPGDAPDGRKQRSASALEDALGFVREHGDSLSELLAYVVLRAEPAARLVEVLASCQARDGSFAPFAPASRGWVGRVLHECGVEDELRGTLEALALFSGARQDDAACAESAVRFVESMQLEDGSFAADPSGRTDGTDGAGESNSVVVTGIAAGSLGRSRFSRPEILAGAGAWLGERFSPDRVEQGHSAERAAFAMYYSNAPDELADEALQWCGRELERGFRSCALESLAVMQVMLACQVGALPGASFAPEELLERLLGEQAADGGFDALSAEGREARVGPTIDGMRAIIGWCAPF